jgi:WD40 repeat protein
MSYPRLIVLAIAAVSAVPALGQEPRADRYGDPLPAGAIARIGTVRLRSPHEISRLAFSPDGKFLVTTASDWPLRVWDAKTGILIREIALPKDEDVKSHPLNKSVIAMAFPSGATRMHVLTQGGTLRACDISNGNWEKPLARTEVERNPLAFGWASPDGTHFFYKQHFKKDAAVAVFAVGKDKPVYQLAETKYGRIGTVSADNQRLLTFGDDGALKVWDLKTDKELCNLVPPAEVFYGGAISPDGKSVVASCGPREERPIYGKPAPAGTTLYKWDVATGKELFRSPDWQGKSVRFSPDGGRVISVLGTEVLVADAATGKLVHRLKGHGAWAIFGAEFSSDGKRLATGSRDHTAIIWDLTTGKAALDFDSPRGPVDVVAISPDEKTVFAGCAEDHTGGLWDADTGRRLHRLDADGKGNPLAAAFTPDGKHVVVGYGVSRATGTGDAWTARLWSVAEGKVVREFGGHTNGVHELAVSPDGKQLATRDWGKKVRAWELDTGKRTHEVEWAEWNESFALVFPRAGELIGVTSNGSGSEVRNLLTDKAVASWKSETRERAQLLSPDGRLLVATEYRPGRSDVWIIKDATSGKEVFTLATPPSKGGDVAAFAPDGKTVAVSGFSGIESEDTVSLFDTATGKELRSFKAHGGQVCALAFSPDGKRLVTGSWDSTVLVWDLAAKP